MASFYHLKTTYRVLLGHLAILTAIMCGFTGQATAGDLTLSDSPYCQAKLDGTITSGDTKRLIQFAKNNKLIDPEGDTIGFALCLNSPGGSLNEAMELARYFKEEVVTTIIDKNDACLSACAVAFMFGTQAAGDFIGSKRAMHVTSRLGFHRPSLAIPNRQDYTDEQIDKALKVILDSVVNLMVEANYVFFGHSQPIMASDLIQLMFKHEGNDFFEIKTVDQVGRWNIEVLGWTPPSQLQLHHVHNACMNLLTWPVGLSANYRPFNYGAGLDLTEYNTFQYAGDGAMGYLTAGQSGYKSRLSLSTPSPAGDDNGGGQCIFALAAEKQNSNFDGTPNPIDVWGISGCGADLTTSVDFGKGECNNYTFEKNPFGDVFYFDQFLRAIALANPKAQLNDLASQRAFAASVPETDCFVLKNGTEVERNKCRASVRKVRRSDGFEYDKVFVWPSGNKTIISHKKTGVTINGKKGIPRDRSQSAPFEECVTNSQSGNEFCHGLRKN